MQRIPSCAVGDARLDQDAGRVLTLRGGDRRGTANLIDSAARSASRPSCIRAGASVSLSRPLLGGDYNATAEHPGFRHETW